ncbi:MAG: glycosyltransferase family 2 protein [Proteobacteria bacterium]|nr:glycosyltransferase family 2 protein [Pseudomonadota bacterium]
MTNAIAGQTPVISIVVPVKNEQGNIAPLVAEITAAVFSLGPYEVIYVNDGSTDRTGEILGELKATRPWLRHIRHQESGGQSAAVRTGVRHARADIVCTLDGDGQNDPAFIPALYQALQAGGTLTGLAQGQRVGRKDTAFKRFQSRFANKVRGAILKDGTRDTGCGLKCFRREAYLSLPYFDAIHRFMPALIVREGYRVVHVDVVDRPRLTGVSNYGFFNRLWVGILDLGGVWWLIRRKKPTPVANEV